MFTDLYELNMAAVYLERDMTRPATFSLFCRRLPQGRPFIVACGLEELLASLETLRFSERDLEYLEGLGLYRRSFLDYLRDFRFAGDVRAVPEGSIVFADEPLLEIDAPLPDAQLVETLVINKIQHATLSATKAALCYLAARGKTLVDFGARRAHSSEAAAAAARAAYVAGFSATSNVEAAAMYGIPPAGTMAHSFVMAFEDEEKAFRAFAERYGERSVLLVDTFDTEAGARKAAEVAREFAARGIKLRGVRIDSGDLAELSKRVRKILDQAGVGWMQILASGNLSERRISETLERGAPIDAFGVGTELTTSADAPSLDIVYKLVSYGGRDVFKLSPGKATYPGPKQVLRAVGSDGKYLFDRIVHRDDAEDAASETASGDGVAELAALLEPAMTSGERTGHGNESLNAKRERFMASIQRFDLSILEGRASYPVAVDARLAERLRTRALD